MGRVIVLGSIITDVVARAPRLPLPGESLIGEDFGTFLGGKGFNLAIAAARLGGSVTLVGCVGSDAFGDAFFPVMAREGVDSRFVQRNAAVGTGVSSLFVSVETGQNVIIAVPKANLTLSSQAVVTALQTLLAEAPGVGADAVARIVFATQCETSRESYTAGLRFAHAAGMTTIFNAAPAPREPLEEDLWRQVNILVVNESEAATLAGMAVDSTTGVRQAIERLLALGAEQVIITLGAQGVARGWWQASDEGSRELGMQWVQALPVKPVDATAAGDAFCGALAAGLAQGMDMRQALMRANAAGAVAVTRVGAFPSLPSLAEVELLLGKSQSGC